MFFFQAEDGIRDLTVTGVQTCALPISSTDCQIPTSVLPTTIASMATRNESRPGRARFQGNGIAGGVDASRMTRSITDAERSEERRVGKECTYRCALDDLKTKSADATPE